MLNPGDTFDGYRLIRRIGSGGFGEVWLCRSETVGDLKALKFVAASRPEMLEKEVNSLNDAAPHPIAFRALISCGFGAIPIRRPWSWKQGQPALNGRHPKTALDSPLPTAASMGYPMPEIRRIRPDRKS